MIILDEIKALIYQIFNVYCTKFVSYTSSVELTASYNVAAATKPLI